MPNDGVLYYRWLFNESRVLITSPKALGEVLVQRNYEFIKPERIRNGLGRLLGVGILLAEGDEHKVSVARVGYGESSTNGYIATKEAFDACLRLSTCQGPIPDFLEQVTRND